jgi:hypothetical protein
MNTLTLLQPHSIMQSAVEAACLEEALKLKPPWMSPLTDRPFLWIFRGENFGDHSLLQTAQFTEQLNLRLRELRIEIIAQYLDSKYAPMRQLE